MVLFLILALTLLLLIGFTILVASLGGAVGIIIFGDVIVCIACIIVILKKIIRKN